MSANAALTNALKAEARRLGFDLVGATPAVRPPWLAERAAWIKAGHAAGMSYLAEHLAAYEHPRFVLDGVRSLLMLAANYGTTGSDQGHSPPTPSPKRERDETAMPPPGRGRVARYALGADYHGWFRTRLQGLLELHRRLAPGGTARGVVDTAPLPEREFAVLAGLGWIGKNTTLITPHFGSWVVLGAVLTSEELVYDPPAPAEQWGCGDCDVCLRACPTGALAAPYQLDARRCLSYLTIEHRGPIDDPMRPALADRVFGCDRCQEVCPHNRATPLSMHAEFAAIADREPLILIELLQLDEDAWRTRFHDTPLWRARRQGLLRNAAIVLGNQRHRPALDVLRRGALDFDSVVAEACRWAIDRICGAGMDH